MTRPAVEYDYAHTGLVRRGLRQVVTQRYVAALSARLLPGLDRVVFRVSRGRVTFSAWVTGLPVLQLTTRGARSGLPRSVRVLGVPDGAGFLVVAANFGRQEHPAWYGNLRRHPRASLAGLGEFDATELHGAERERGFERAVALNPGWRRFARTASGRAIPVLKLTPVS